MNDNTKSLRRSIPTQGAHAWWACGWIYVMPDFDKPNHSIVEWMKGGAPVEPNRVHAASQTGVTSGSRGEL